MKRSPLKRKSPIRILGKDPVSVTKREIQALLRLLAIKRDGGCVLRHYEAAGARTCAGRKLNGELVSQAEHLITRANSVTFGDMRNIVCLCPYHHLLFKKQYGSLYWELIEREIGPERWAWMKRAEQDKRPYKIDWKLVKLALEQDLKHEEETLNI